MHRVCAFTTEYLDLIDCNYTTELYAAVRCTSMCSHVPAMYLCCCSLCCDTAIVPAVVSSAGAACWWCCSSCAG